MCNCSKNHRNIKIMFQGGVIMKIALVGYSGFVGSNIYNKGNTFIDGLYNSRNITTAYNTKPDILIYAGLRAEKYLANIYPEKDMELINEAKYNIQQINPKKLVLISTIDVFKNPENVDENTKIDTVGLQAYGYNRYQLEYWVRENYQDVLIIRLPALFGDNIKKNFLYDYIKFFPQMLKKEKINELAEKDNNLFNYYTQRDEQFYVLKDINKVEKRKLKELLQKLEFSALNFTDSRNSYQFYNLENLWNDIQTALKNNLTIWHSATEPVYAGEIYSYLTGKSFVNEIAAVPVKYDYKTVYNHIFGGNNGYIKNKNEVLAEIKKFVEKQIKIINM